MFDGLLDQLLQQEVVYQQYRGGDGQSSANQPASADAIRNATSTTLTATVVGGTLNVELPQAIGPGATPTFVSVNFTNPAAVRASLGLGGLALLNAAAASADTAPAQTAAYVQADVQAILDELRALKTSLRTAGVLLP
ncbi:MAG TPA: hypothetical protein PLQ88_30550 [Blastocatellia bacterium]|nr:hypothetical protein [Blastocatellia bacterium]HMV87925.1 hypothetical protein [Blastocatellia bacterium]HMY76198.1 hypothetical protein [Blastocatellia bacterium]